MCSSPPEWCFVWYKAEDVVLQHTAMSRGVWHAGVALGVSPYHPVGHSVPQIMARCSLRDWSISKPRNLELIKHYGWSGGALFPGFVLFSEIGIAPQCGCKFSLHAGKNQNSHTCTRANFLESEPQVASILPSEFWDKERKRAWALLQQDTCGCQISRQILARNRLIL